MLTHLDNLEGAEWLRTSLTTFEARVASFEALRRSAYTDSLGIAWFRDLPIGWHRIVIRTPGYGTRRDSVHVSAASGTVGVYVLPRRKFESCQVVITH